MGLTSKRIKKIMLMLTLSALCTITGCSNRYPRVCIDTGAFKAVQSIDIGNNYKYVDFDVIETDTGKDVIVHFERNNENEPD